MNFDIIVVGGGHAGLEASAVCAKMGKKTLLLTTLIEQIAAASCNPAIGGLAKGHLVKEIDAMGALMGQITDLAGLQFRIMKARVRRCVEAEHKLIWICIKFMLEISFLSLRI